LCKLFVIFKKEEENVSIIANTRMAQYPFPPPYNIAGTKSQPADNGSVDPHATLSVDPREREASSDTSIRKVSWVGRRPQPRHGHGHGSEGVLLTLLGLKQIMSELTIRPTDVVLARLEASMCRIPSTAFYRVFLCSFHFSSEAVSGKVF
jgi:hypothetical protein